MGDMKKDISTIKKCIKGSSVSWRDLIDDFIGLVYSAVYNTMLKHSKFVDPADVDDVCQNVFVSLFANDCKVLRRYDPQRAKLSTWLTVISRNFAIDFIRKKKMMTIPLEEVVEELRSPTSVEPVTIDIPDGVLTPRQHLVLRMMYDDGLDVAEVAYFMGIKRQSVRSLHHRALTRLREHYGFEADSQPSLKVVNENK